MISTVDEAIKAVGGTGAVAVLFGVGAAAVSNWKARGSIPAEYFPVFADELAARGKEVDRRVFGFREAICP